MSGEMKLGEITEREAHAKRTLLIDDMLEEIQYALLDTGGLIHKNELLNMPVSKLLHILVNHHIKLRVWYREPFSAKMQRMIINHKIEWRTRASAPDYCYEDEDYVVHHTLECSGFRCGLGVGKQNVNDFK